MIVVVDQCQCIEFTENDGKKDNKNSREREREIKQNTKRKC